MKNKDLIKKLQALDPEAEVIVRSDNFEIGQANIAVEYVDQFNEGSKKVETFRDAFDGDTYNKETYSIIGGNLKVIKIS